MKTKLKSLLAIASVLVCAISNVQAAKVAPTVTIKTELAAPVVLADQQKHNYLKISLTGNELPHLERVPMNLALVIDRSSSMSGDRIEKAKEAAILIISMLQPEDTLSVVTYDSQPQVVIPITKVKNKNSLIRKVKEIEAGGMTALFAGLSKGINEISRGLDKEKVNRIVLLSDGQANVGPSSVNELSDLAIVAAKKGIPITTIGLGTGYNEALMAAIASYSDGNHAFVEHSAELETVFVKEFKEAMSAVAQDITITIQLAKGMKPVRLLGRSGELGKNHVRVRMSNLYANQEQYVLLELEPEKGGDQQKKKVADVSIQYQDLMTKKMNKSQQTVDISYTNNAKSVQSAVVEDVFVESEIQKVAIENKEAIELYNQGKKDEAKTKISRNKEKIKNLEKAVVAPDAKSRLSEMGEFNSSMLSTMDNAPELYQKKATEIQLKSEKPKINKKK